jgi:N-glycosylase/DNA lyase
MENKDLKWLNELRGQPYHIVKDSLLNLPGVGRKVADCICLMSMDVADCVPVDTHVWQMAIRDYKVKMATSKSLTDKNYTVIASCFQNVFGKYAGWAHSVLFAADLKFLEEFSHEWIDKELPDVKLFEIGSKENSDLSV